MSIYVTPLVFILTDYLTRQVAVDIHNGMTLTQLPKYQQVKRAIIQEIEEGRLAPGSAIPSEAELLQRFKVSRPTLVRSFQDLVRDGWVYRKQGKGTYVADRSIQFAGDALSEDRSIPLFVHDAAVRQSGDAKEVLIHLVRGIQAALEVADYSLVLRSVPEMSRSEAIEFLGARPPEVALVVEPSSAPNLWRELLERNVNAWAILDHVEDGNCVYIDQEQAGYLAARHLLDRGCTKLALLNGPLSAYWGFGARLAGFKRALAECNAAFFPELVLEGVHVVDSEAGRAMMRSLLASGRMFDGVVGVSDGKTIGAMMAAEEAGKQVGREIQFVSIDNTVAEFAPHPLTSVAMAFEEAGRLAASLAISPLFTAGSTPTLTQCRLTPTVVVRQEKQ